MNLKGIFPPILIPFKTNGDLDLDALQFNLARWSGYDLAGFVVLGSFGESVYMTFDEKVAVLEASRASIPSGKLLIAGTGCETTAETHRLTAAAAKAGADAAIVVTPHFYDHLMEPALLERHFTSVADAAPIPVLLYNVPLFTHVDLTVESIVALAAHENIPGMKESSGDIVKMAKILGQAPDFQMLTGSGSAFLGALSIGASGGVMGLANVASEATLRMMTLFEQGQTEAAADLQRRLVPVDHAITFTYGIAGAKAALDLLGYRGGSVRAPLADLDPAGREEVRRILIKAGLLSG